MQKELLKIFIKIQKAGIPHILYRSQSAYERKINYEIETAKRTVTQ